MRTKRTIKNMLFNVFQQIVGIIVSFILPPMIISHFGSVINGLVSTIKEIMRYAGLVGAGIAATSTYALYKPLANNDKKKVNGIYNATNKMFIKSGNIFTIIILLSSLIYPFIAEGEVNKITVGLLVIVMGIAGLSEFYVIGKYQSLLNAEQKNYVVAIAQTVGNIFNIIVAFILIKLNQNIVIVQLGASIIYVMRILIITLYIKKHYKYLDNKVTPLESEIKQRKDAVIHEITALIVNASSVVLISFFLGFKYASIYAIYLLVFSGLNTICGIVSNAIYASFGEVIAKKEMKVLNKAFNIYEWIYLFTITIIYTVAFLLIMPFISVYTKNMTDINYYLPILGALLSIVGLINNMKIPARTLVVASGHFKETRNRSIIEMTINIVGQVICIPIFGIYGAPIGCILSNLYRTVDFIIYANKEILNIKNGRIIKRIITNLTVSILIVAVMIVLIPQRTDSYMNWILSALVVSLITFIIQMVINLITEKDMLKETKKIIIGLIGG